MKRYVSSVSPKGQITLPREVRELLGVAAKDRVEIRVERDIVTVSAARSSLDTIYQSVPALDPPRSWDEMTGIAAEEQARNAAHEGL